MLERRRYKIAGVASRPQYREILRGRRHQRILKVDNSNSIAMLEVQIMAVIVAMRKNARIAIESRRDTGKLGLDRFKRRSGRDHAKPDFLELVELPRKQAPRTCYCSRDASIRAA